MMRCSNLGDELGKEVESSLVKKLQLPAFSASLEKAGLEIVSNKEKETLKFMAQSGKMNESEAFPPFILGEALPVVPAKLAKRILRGEYIDMAELLKDNIEAERRRLASTDEGGGPSRGTCRAIPNLLSWLRSYTLLAAIICSKYPEKSREMWVYQATIIGEAKRLGGNGWYLYDSAFRQQISSIEKADFSKINQSLYSTTFLAYADRSQFCPNCMLSDHTQEECALTPCTRQGMDSARGGQRRRSPEHGRKSPEQRRKQRQGACFAWNDGRCARSPYCPFQHVCCKCFRDHKRAACRADGREANRERP